MKKFSLVFLLSLLLCLIFALPANAADIKVSVGGKDYQQVVTNTAYTSKTDFAKGSKIEITSDKDLVSAYIVWSTAPSAWKLDDTKTIDDGFLHQYVKLDSPSKSFTMTLDEAQSICFIKAFADGEEPKDLQKWQKPQDEVDVLAFAAHADDESLFLGGAIVDIIANHPDMNVQLAVMTNHLATEKHREHERLDAMWTLGLTNYPIVGDVKDAYSMDLESGLKTCNYDEVLETFKGYITKYKPQVIITQDFEGEYGHGQHRVMAKAVAEAVDTLAESNTFDVKKTYIHLYKENAMELNLQVPLDSFGGMTALDVAKEAYKKHASQQWCWFYVSDDYKYSCDEFGLYRTSVGTDTGKDMIENITSYKAIHEEEERIAAEKAKEAEKSKPKATVKKENKASSIFTKIIYIILGAVVFVILLIVALRVYNKNRRAKKYQPKHGKK